MWEIMLLTLIKSHSISWGPYKQRNFSEKEKNSASSLQYKNSVWVFNLLTCFIDFGVNTATLTWISRLQPFLTDFTLANCHNCVSQLLNSIKCVYTRSYICIYTHISMHIFIHVSFGICRKNTNICAYSRPASPAVCPVELEDMKSQHSMYGSIISN